MASRKVAREVMQSMAQCVLEAGAAGTLAAAVLLVLVGIHMFLVVRIGISAPPKASVTDEDEPEVEVEA